MSRLRNDIVSDQDIQAGAQLMRWLKALEDNRDLVNIGAYVAGADPNLDMALARENDIKAYLQQGIKEGTALEDSLAHLRRLTGVA